MRQSMPTSRPDDPRSVYQTDWDGKLNRFVLANQQGEAIHLYVSAGGEKHRQMPLMDIKPAAKCCLKV